MTDKSPLAPLAWSMLTEDSNKKNDPYAQSIRGNQTARVKQLNHNVQGQNQNEKIKNKGGAIFKNVTPTNLKLLKNTDIENGIKNGISGYSQNSKRNLNNQSENLLTRSRTGSNNNILKVVSTETKDYKKQQLDISQEDAEQILKNRLMFDENCLRETCKSANFMQLHKETNNKKKKETLLSELMFENLRLSLRSIGGKSYAGPFGQYDPMNGLQEAEKEGSDDDEYEPILSKADFYSPESSLAVEGGQRDSDLHAILHQDQEVTDFRNFQSKQNYGESQQLMIKKNHQKLYRNAEGDELIESDDTARLLSQSKKPRKTNNLQNNIFEGGNKPKKQRQPKQIDTNLLSGDQAEADFEIKALEIIQEQEWQNLEKHSVDHLDTNKQSAKGYFYLGVALYKLCYFDQALKAFRKSAKYNTENSQLHYNLGLAYFKKERYNYAVEHLKICIKLDPKNLYAYNNLAFIYNMHQKYPEAIEACNLAQNNNSDIDITCHRHWAFALFKTGSIAKAVQKIKESIFFQPDDADNWVVWGMIMRSIGNYQSAKHKFERALKLDPKNETAMFEQEILEAVLQMDECIELDQIPKIQEMRAKKYDKQHNQIRKSGVCTVVYDSVCSIF